MPFIHGLVVLIVLLCKVLLASEFFVYVNSVNDLLHLLKPSTILEVGKAGLHLSALNLCLFVHALVVGRVPPDHLVR